ncbi:MAG: lipopolysaccharide kinase InaA family protein [Endozoicomonas sp.]
MQQLSSQQYQAMRDGAEVIERDHSGDKVLRLRDRTFLKLFEVKSFFSSALLLPYSVRFARNAERLHRLGVPTVEIKECYRIASIKRTAVHYQPLPGQTLRQALADMGPAQKSELTERNARFIARLHDLGVYFRSLHMGNILLQPDGTLGLIDVADMRFYRRGLNKTLRLRNFRHMARYRVDVEHLLEDDTFCSVYADLAGLDVEQVVSVIRSVKGR